MYAKGAQPKTCYWRCHVEERRGLTHLCILRLDHIGAGLARWHVRPPEVGPTGIAGDRVGFDTLGTTPTSHRSPAA